MWSEASDDSSIRFLLSKHNIVHPFSIIYMDVDQALFTMKGDWSKYLEIARDLVNTIHCLADKLNHVFNTPPEALTREDLKRTHLIAKSLKQGTGDLALTQLSRAMANIECVLSLCLSSDETARAEGEALHNFALSSFHAFCYSVEVLTKIVDNNCSDEAVRNMVSALALAPFPQ